MTNQTKPETKSKTGRLAFRIVLLLLLSIFIGTSVYSLNARRVFRNAMPMPFGLGSSVVLSGSMEPTLSIHDLVLVKAQEDYQVGDIVVYQSGGSLVIHRIVELRDGGYVTKGDANNTEDGVVAPEAVKGRMFFRVPYLGAAVRFLQTLPGAVLVIALAAFLINRSWTRERAEDDEQLEQIKEEIRRLKDREEAAGQEKEDPEHPAE